MPISLSLVTFPTFAFFYSKFTQVSPISEGIPRISQRRSLKVTPFFTADAREPLSVAWINQTCYPAASKHIT